MRYKNILLITALIIMLLLPSASTLTSLADEETVTGTYATLSVNNTYMKGGSSQTIQVNITNTQSSQSIEEVYIIINATGSSFIAQPYTDNIHIVSALVYNSTGDQVAAWSYGFFVWNNNGENYAVIAAYTSAGSNALQNGWTVSVTLQVNTTSEGGIYPLDVVVMHINPDNTVTQLETLETSITIDSQAPSYTVITPSSYEGTYYTSVEHGSTADYTLFKFNITDTLDGSTQVNLSKYPITITNVEATLINDTGTYPLQVDTSSSLLDDYTLGLTLNVTFNATYSEGDRVNVYVEGVDHAGNPFHIGVTATIDTTPPNIQLLGIYHDENLTNLLSYYYIGDSRVYVANNNDNIIYVELEVTDNTAVNNNSVAFYVTNLTHTVSPLNVIYKGDGIYVATVDISGLSEGSSYELSAYAEDIAGNARDQSFIDELEVDRTPPSVHVYVNDTPINPVVPYHISSAASLQVNVSDALSGFNAGESAIVLYNYTDITMTTQTGSMDLSFNTTYSLNKEACYKIDVTAYDNAGNVFTASYIVVVDLNPPAIADLKVYPVSTLGSDNYTNSNTLYLNFTAWDVYNYTVDVFVNGSQYFNAHISGNVTFEAVDLTLGGSGEGPYNITVYASDGYHTSSKTVWVVYDITPPQLDTATSSLDDLNNTVIDANVNGTIYNLVFNDALSPIKNYTVTLNGNALSGVPASGVDTASIMLDFSEVNSIWGSSGWKNLTVTVWDYSGNSRTITISFYNDMTPPEIGNTDFVVQEYIGELMTLNTTITDDYGIGLIELHIGNFTPITLYSASGTPVKEYNLSETLNLTDYGITLDAGVNYSVVLTVTDYYGYTYSISEGHQASATDYVMLDNQPPAITLVSPNILYDHVFWSNTDPATATVLVEDDGVGVKQIYVYVDGSLEVNETLGEYTASYTVSASVAGEGVHNVTVIAEDYLGNTERTMYNVGIDITPPNVTAVVTPLRGGELVKNISSSDNLSGLTDSYQLTLTVNGDTWVIEVPVSVLGGGYYFGYFNDTGLSLMRDWKSLLNSTMDYYVETFTGKEFTPALAVVDGELMVFLQYMSQPENVSLSLSISDIAGNVGVYSVSGSVANGAFFPVMVYHGWNFLSSPTLGTFTASSLTGWLTAADGEITEVVAWSYEDDAYLTYIPGVSSGDIVLHNGESFWVHFNGTEGIILFQGGIPFDTPSGAPPTPITYAVRTGDNFLGYTGLASMDYSSYFGSIPSGAVYGYIYVYDTVTGLWYTEPINSEDTIMPGTGFWLYAYQDTSLIVPPWYQIRVI